MADLTHISSDGSRPDVAYAADGVGDGNVKSLQSMTETSVRETIRAGVDAAWGDAQFSLGGLLGLLGDILRTGAALGGALLEGFVNGVIGLIQAVADGIRGLLPSSSPFSPVQEAFRDGQLEITDRIDLLEGIQGYAAAYQTKNIYVGSMYDSGWRDLPYKGQFGPSKNITLDTANGHMVLGSSGLFVVYARAHARATNDFGGNDFVYMRIQCVTPQGGLYSECHVEKSVPRNQHQTVNVSWPVVVPGPGYRIKVRTYTDNYRWWDGGTRYSTLHVIQHSTVFENQAPETVPDE